MDAQELQPKSQQKKENRNEEEKEVTGKVISFKQDDIEVSEFEANIGGIDLQATGNKRSTG